MEAMLPVGSVVEVQGKKVMLLGGALQERDGKVVCCYYIVPYPRGFVTMESLSFMPADLIEKVCHTGYSDATGEKYLKGLTITYENLVGKTTEEAKQLIEKASAEFQAFRVKQEAKNREEK